MKTSILHLLISLCTVQALAQQTINSAADFEKLVLKAREQHKPIFLDFYTTWCVPCQQMDKVVFNRSDVQQLLGNQYTSARIDAGTKFGYLLKQQFKVAAYPTFLYLDNERVPLHTEVGRLDPEAFLILTKRILTIYAAN